ncbi:MAG: GNAT family N-acetyltransferase [Clostridiales bacterium]|nr:GNAT family N-acetyltransferase [Clostridiales bacterium]
MSTVREAKFGDLKDLLELYLFLHETSIPNEDARLKETWEKIMNDPNYHLIVNEIDGKLVSSCTCLIVPNLTHDVHPYAFVENVVTAEDYRGKGYATQCLDYARDLAKKEGCYKIMLMTGSKKETTLRFYENAGYNKESKTAFYQAL